MTKNDLLNAIRVIVQEEVRSQLPNILIEILSEKTGSDQQVVSERAPTPTARPTVKKSPQPTASKKYSSNPTLNAILNETVGGIPSEDVATVGVSIPKEVLTENSALVGVANAMSRDYRQLLRATDKKAKASRGGALNFQSPVPTNFDQES